MPKTIQILSYILAGTLYITNGAAQQAVKVTAINSNVHTRALYKVEFICEQPLASDASFEVIFPKGFILSKSMIAGSNTMNGGLEVTVQRDTIYVRRSGLGAEIPAGTNIDIMLSDIINPAKAGDDYEIYIQVKNNQKVDSIRAVKAPVSIKAQ